MTRTWVSTRGDCRTGRDTNQKSRSFRVSCLTSAMRRKCWHKCIAHRRPALTLLRLHTIRFLNGLTDQDISSPTDKVPRVRNYAGGSFRICARGRRDPPNPAWTIRNYPVRSEFERRYLQEARSVRL